MPERLVVFAATEPHRSTIAFHRCQLRDECRFSFGAASTDQRIRLALLLLLLFIVQFFGVEEVTALVLITGFASVEGSITLLHASLFTVSAYEGITA